MDGDAAETINGVASITLNPGDSIHYTTTGATGWEGTSAIDVSFVAHDHTGTPETQIPTDGLANGAATYAKVSFSNEIDQSDIASSAIGIGELKETIQQNTATPGILLTDIAYTGGLYSLGLALSRDGSNAPANDVQVVAGVGGSYASEIGLRSLNTGITYYFQVRYFQASPPYDLGDGDIALFLEAIIDNGSGDILAINSAKDPAWANNGPTNITPDRNDKESGRNFKTVYDFPPGLERPLPEQTPLQAKINHQKARAEFMKTPAFKEIEITKEFKNSDMNDFPHHFKNTDLTGKTIVLLDPVSSVVEELMLLRDAGGDIHKMIMDGYFNIDSTQITRNGPPGVQVVSIDWKNTP
jgi:hypothetical protein